MPDHLIVDERVLAAFGKTLEEVRAMTLGEFLETALSKGYDIKVDPFREAEEGKGHLHVTMAEELQNSPVI